MYLLYKLQYEAMPTNNDPFESTIEDAQDWVKSALESCLTLQVSHRVLLLGRYFTRLILIHDIRVL